MKIKMLFIACAIILTACNSSQKETLTSSASPAGKTQSYDDGMSMDESEEAFEENIQERKLIVEGSISFKTSDIVETRIQILKAVEKYKGYISSDQEFNSAYSFSNNLIVRIPSDSLSDFIESATMGVARFDNKTIETKDVSEQYADISTQIKNKKALEKRFVSLLSKANNVREILEIEREIARLRTAIENKEGSIKNMDSRISYSTINFNFYTQITDKPRYVNKFSEGFANGWKNLVLFLVGAVNLWPFIILSVGISFGIKLILKKRRA